MRNILYLIEDILFRGKQENTAESVRNHLYRLRQHKQSNNDGHDLVEIRRNFLSRRFSQKNLREESQRNTDAAKKIDLPAVNLRFHCRRDGFFMEVAHKKKHQKAEKRQNKLKSGNLPIIKMASALQ